jgi:hypothetical protein
MSRRETLNPKSRWDLTDACVLLGRGLVVAGIVLTYLPAGLIAAGAVLVALVIFTH